MRIPRRTGLVHLCLNGQPQGPDVPIVRQVGSLNGTGSSPVLVAGCARGRRRPLRSGSLSTASHAMGNKTGEVFAVPGPADSLSSRGCHRLIRDGAQPGRDGRRYPWKSSVRSFKRFAPPPAELPLPHPAELALSDSERSLLGRLSDDQPTAVDELDRTTPA